MNTTSTTAPDTTPADDLAQITWAISPQGQRRLIETVTDLAGTEGWTLV
ncbi:hypothetical protein ACFXKD_00410 [Nocardiopsis aegyptia]